jgi:hypothetical protein
MSAESYRYCTHNPQPEDEGRPIIQGQDFLNLLFDSLRGARDHQRMYGALAEEQPQLLAFLDDMTKRFSQSGQKHFLRILLIVGQAFRAWFPRVRPITKRELEQIWRCLDRGTFNKPVVCLCDFYQARLMDCVLGWVDRLIQFNQF